MKRTNLTPDAAAWLAETLRRNRATYGGLRMQADGDDGAGGDDKPKDDPAGGDEGDDKPLGAAGEKALKAEREANKAMRARLDQLEQGDKDFKTTLAAALGIKADGDEGDQQADLLASVQEQIKGMQREAAVLKLANAHQITDEADLELLASAKDDEAMKRLAERLAPTADEGKEEKGKRQPKPDRTQGGGSGGRADTSGVSHGRSLYQSSRGKTS